MQCGHTKLKHWAIGECPSGTGRKIEGRNMGKTEANSTAKIAKNAERKAAATFRVEGFCDATPG